MAKITFAATKAAKERLKKRLAEGLPDKTQKPYECEQMKRAREMAKRAVPDVKAGIQTENTKQPPSADKNLTQEQSEE